MKENRNGHKDASIRRNQLGACRLGGLGGLVGDRGHNFGPLSLQL